MKKLFFVLGLLLTGLTNANAYYCQTDCCGAPCMSPCATIYNGLYVGGNLGVISLLAFHNEEDNVGLKAKYFTATGFTAGAQAGYDWNCGCGVLGLVIDWDWSNVEQTHTALSGDKLKDEVDWYLTLRGRAGVVSFYDCLFYLTAGGVLTRFDTKWRVDGTTDIFHEHESRWGWTGGVGAEYLLGCSWSLGADLLYMFFGHDRKSFTTSAGGTDKLGSSNSVWVARVRLNYHLRDLMCLF